MLASATITMAPQQWQLRRESGSAYYILMICELSGQFFLVQQSGKMGARYRLSPQFRGLPIGSIEGYSTIEEAYEKGCEEIDTKKKQKPPRRYVELSKNEHFYYSEEEGRGAVHLMKKEVNKVV